MLVTFASISQKQSNSGALAREAFAAEHHLKFGYLCIQEVLALTKSSVRPPFHVSGCEMAHFLARSPEGIYYLAPVVQKVDSTIHRINLCSVDSTIGFPNTCPQGRDLSDGKRYAALEKLGPVV